MMEIERPKIETVSLSPDGRYGKFVDAFRTIVERLPLRFGQKVACRIVSVRVNGAALVLC